MRDSSGISSAHLRDGEVKIKVATTRVQVTQLLFKLDTVIGGGGGGVRLAPPLPLKRPPEFQSPPYSVSQMMHSQKNLKHAVAERRLD